MSDYDHLLKVIIVGDGGAGGTELMKRISFHFDDSSLITVGVEFALKTIEVAGQKFKLQLWMTGGQERFSYIRPLYYRGAVACIYIFDVTNRASFEHLTKWHEEVTENTGEIISVIAATNIDSDNREVSNEEIEELASKICYPYMPEASALEISLKDNYGIEQLFTNICWFFAYHKDLIPPEQPEVVQKDTTPPPEFLAQLPSVPEKIIQEPTPSEAKNSDLLVFISCSIKESDKFQIKRIAERLKSFSEIKDVLYWEEDAEGSIIQYMNKNIPNCDTFLLFCSQTALNSHLIEMEYETALYFKRRIIPIFEDLKDVPPVLMRLRGVRFEPSNIKLVINELHQFIAKKVKK